MKYILKPSLQQMALVKIATELWNQVDIRNLVQKFTLSAYSVNSNKEWQEVDQKIMKKLTQLKISSLLKREILSISRPIFAHIVDWWSYHHYQTRLVHELPKQFAWTSRGTIDRKRMAEMLVKDEEIDVESRYKLACFYCLEEEVPELWKRITKERERNFYSEEDAAEIIEDGLVVFWTYHIKGELSKLDALIHRKMGPNVFPLHFACYSAIIGINLVALKYFFDKLSCEEQSMFCALYGCDMNLQLHINKSFSPQTFYFLLTEISEDQQETLQRNCHSKTLSCFLNWPFQPLFMDLAKQIMSSRFLPNQAYILLSVSIIDKITGGWTDFDYRELFNGFWRLTPLSCKRRALSLMTRDTLINLLEAEEIEILKSVLRDADDVEKHRLILCSSTHDICMLLLRDDKLTSVLCLIELCATSIEVMMRFRIDFEKYRHYCKNDKEVTRRRYTLLRHVDDLIRKKNEKRKVEEMILPLKKLCLRS